jgi:hypothetical protein
MRRKSAAAFCLMYAMLGATPVFAEGAQASSPPVENVTPLNQRPTSKPAETQAAMPGSTPVAPRPASSADRMSYATREAASPNAKNYKGGDAVVVIGASTATVILAVVLLIVLL